MDLPGVLSSMAEGSITLAGFAAVFRAFRGSHDPDGFSDVRLTVVIEGGLVVAFLCYLPAWLSSAGLSPDAVWRSTSIVGALWTFFPGAGPGCPIPGLVDVICVIGRDGNARFNLLSATWLDYIKCRVSLDEPIHSDRGVDRFVEVLSKVHGTGDL